MSAGVDVIKGNQKNYDFHSKMEELLRKKCELGKLMKFFKDIRFIGYLGVSRRGCRGWKMVENVRNKNRSVL